MTSLTGSERTAVLDRVKELVAIETPSLDLEASARIAATLGRAYESLGATVRAHANDTGIHLIADFAGDGDPLLLIGHSDTVWPLGSLTADVPLRHQGDVLAGPGAFDMKSGLVIIETALRRAERRRAVRVVITADEEVGSPGSRRIVEQACQGVTGAIGFESPHPDGALKIGRRGSTRLRIDVTGRAAHAALDPGLGISAIDELVDQLVGVRSYLAELAASGREVLGNVGTIAGGTRANVVAERATAELGLRFIDPETEALVLERLRHPVAVRPGAVIDVQLASHRPAWLARDIDIDFAAALSVQAAADLPARPAAGAGDVNFVAALGVPCVDGFGPRGRSAHAVDEQLSIESMLDRIGMLTRILSATAAH